jgi:peptide/nickel transport system substrate-binding protein
VGSYCKPLTTNLPIPNNTITWCINSTFGYINLTNWKDAISAATPGTDTYYELVKVYHAWFLYWVPAVAISQIMLGQTFPKSMIDPYWAYDCINYSNPKYTAAAYSLFHDWAMGWGWDGFDPFWNILIVMGAFAPPGVIPPLAQAIINGSLWTNPYFHK